MTTTLQILDINIRTLKPVHWPHYAGGTLRGAFGRALRKAACITGKHTCNDCPLRTSCAYGAVFDPLPPAVPLHPSFQNGIPLYVVRPCHTGAAQLDPGQMISFQLLLMPGAKTYTDLIKHVIKEAIERELEKPGTFELLSVQSQDLQTVSVPMMVSNVAEINDINEKSQLTLRLLTPLRLQEHGKPIQDRQKLTAEILVRAVLRRYLQWCQVNHLDTIKTDTFLSAAELCQLDSRNIHWHDMARRSNTQQKKVPLGGLVGSLLMEGPKNALDSLQALLELCTLIHFGKETVMGLGQISVQRH